MPLPIIPVGQWVELPNTKFADFAVANNIPVALPSAYNGRATMFEAWTSPLFDRSRQRLVWIRPGGHGDYPGAGCYAFNLSNLQWQTLKPHVANAARAYGSAGFPPLDMNQTNQLFTPSKIRVHSSDATDDRTASIVGEDTTGNVITENIQIAGTTVVLTTTTFRWIVSITLSGPNAGSARTAHFRREDNTTGVWPTKSNEIISSAFRASVISGPFNIQALNQLLGASAYYSATPTTADKTQPSAVHTYDSVCHLVSHDKYYSGGGIYSGYGENTPPTIWIFDPVTNTWALTSVNGSSRPGGGTCCSVWDPTLNLLWIRPSSGLYTYDLPTNTHVTRNTTVVGSTTTGKLIIDDAGRKVYFVSPVSGNSLTIYEYNIANPNAVVLSTINPTGTLDIRKINSTQLYEGIGAFFLGGRIGVVGRASSGSNKIAIYSLNPSQPVWTIHESPDLAAPNMIATGGIWNKVSSPDDVHLIYMNIETENIWAYRVPWSTASPYRPIGLTARLK